MKPAWMDASLHSPPDDGLLLVIENDGCLVADMAFGFYAEGQYHVGTSMAGDVLLPGQIVRYWAVPEWPEGYDEIGGCQTHQRFTLNNGFDYLAKQCEDGILIDPKLPPAFDSTPNNDRCGQAKYWFVPFVVTESIADLDAFYASRTDESAEAGRERWSNGGRDLWLQAWPTGTRYEVRCLDGGAWDRATSWGFFPTLQEAIHCAKSKLSA